MDTAEYAEQSAQYGKVPSEVKITVDLSSVILAYGIALEPVASGDRLIGLCPFHDDTVPSFSVWQSEDWGWQCGCWSCDFSPGDIFTFLMRWHECGFAEAVGIATTLRATDLPDPPPINVEHEVRATVSLDKILSRGTEFDAVHDLLNARGLYVPAPWLKREFEICADGDTVLIPHWDYAHRNLIGIKRRAAYLGWKNIAARGSEFGSLYGIWRDEGSDTVILCEGESDTWTVAYLYRDHDVEVFGLPCGAAATPRTEWLKELEGSTVVLLFDGDRAGREGAARWAEYLALICPDVYIAALPEGFDATSVAEKEVLESVEKAKAS